MAFDGGVADDDSSSAQSRIKDYRAQEHEYLRAAVKSSHGSVDTGHATTQELVRQGETIDKVDADMDKIEYELKVSDKLVKNMSGIKGMFASWFMKDPKPPKKSPGCCDTSDVKPGDDARIVRALPPSGGKDAGVNSSAQAMPKRTQKFGANDVSSEASAHDADTEKMLDELTNNLSVMRDQAVTQQGILRQQHQRLDELNAKVDKTGSHMNSTNQKIRKIT